jgi:hypothetical protein
VTLAKATTADGKPLAAGTYQGPRRQRPSPTRRRENIERWVEFVRKHGQGREVLSIVPQNEVKNVVKDPPPASGASKVQMLKGNDFPCGCGSTRAATTT